MRVSDLVKIADPAKRAEIDAPEGEIESTCERQVRSVAGWLLDPWGSPVAPTPAWPSPRPLTLWEPAARKPCPVQRQNEQLTRLTEQARPAGLPTDRSAAHCTRRSCLSASACSLSATRRQRAAAPARRDRDARAQLGRRAAGTLFAHSIARSLSCAGPSRSAARSRSLYGELARAPPTSRHQRTRPTPAPVRSLQQQQH